MTTTGVTAVAHPNIALVKYWGKQDKPGNIPATPNLSITLDHLTTTTTVLPADEDTFVLDGRPTGDRKVTRFLATLREQFDVPPVRIESASNFPTGSGLASSASGFAALMVALNAHAELGLNAEIMSEWARTGSASAARSLFGGYVALVPPLWRAQQLAPAGHWPLATVVAITSEAPKAVGSTEGMERTRATSPYFNAWTRSSGDDFATVSEAVTTRDFAQLAAAAEHSCLKMHALMLSTRPALVYWNAATLQCMQAVAALRETGTPVFFTIDAGPQVKAVCLPEAAATVADTLGGIPGVLRTITCGLGDGARLQQ